MSGATPLLPRVPSWLSKEQLYLDMENIVTAGPEEQEAHLDFQYRYTHFPKYFRGFFILINLDVPLLQLQTLFLQNQLS